MPVLFAAMTCNAGETAGYVLEVQGRWLQKGALAALTVGAPVPAGALILAPAPSAGDRITVVAARTGSVLAARRCDDLAACRRPLAMPAAPAAPAAYDFLHRVFAALADQPDRYVTTLNRTATSPRDEVLVWEAGRLDLARLLAERPEAVYDIALAPMGCASAGRCADAPVEARLVWSPRAAPPSVELAQPGLFELSLRRAGESAALPPERSWVLAVPRADEATARSRLRAATALADSWGVAVDADAKRAFTRAAMSIADR
ncbi:MAG: hypothetical protein ABIQ06_05785 [Caldimonas sp.]